MKKFIVLVLTAIFSFSLFADLTTIVQNEAIYIRDDQNDNIPILYIVGLRNNTLSLLDPYIDDYEEKDLRTISKVMNVALAGCK